MLSFQKRRTPPPPSPRVATPNTSSSLGQTMAQGLAFGAGNAVAHEAVRSVMHSNTPVQTVPSKEHIAYSHPCKAILEELHECLEKEYNCDHILDKLVGCLTSKP